MQGSLRYLGLIGRVAGQKLRPLYQRRDGRRCIVVVHTGTGKTHQLVVVVGQTAYVLPYLDLAHGLGQLVVALEPYLVGHLGIEVVQRTHAYARQHLPDVLVGLWKIFVSHSRRGHFIW